MSEESNPYQAPKAEAGAIEAHSLAGVSVTTTMMDHLRKTRPWVRFLATLGFVFLGLIALFGIGTTLASIFGSGRSGRSGLFESYLMIIPGLLYGGMLVLYFFPILHLHRFAGSLKRLLAEGGTRALEDAMRHQKSFWKFAGILTAVTAGLVILTMVLSVVLAAAGIFAGIFG